MSGDDWQRERDRYLAQKYLRERRRARRERRKEEGNGSCLGDILAAVGLLLLCAIIGLVFWWETLASCWLGSVIGVFSIYLALRNFWKKTLPWGMIVVLLIFFAPPSWMFMAKNNFAVINYILWYGSLLFFFSGIDFLAQTLNDRFF